MTKISKLNHAEKLTVDISVIVPCIDEAHHIPALLRVLHEAGSRFDGEWEIIFVDGGSTDGTQDLCKAHAGVRIIDASPSRAVQMNVGAKEAKGSILYFVHADTRPPISCFEDILSAVSGEAQMGGYAFEMDYPGTRLVPTTPFPKKNTSSASAISNAPSLAHRRQAPANHPFGRAGKMHRPLPEHLHAR